MLWGPRECDLGWGQEGALGSNIEAGSWVNEYVSAGQEWQRRAECVPEPGAMKKYVTFENLEAAQNGLSLEGRTE